jgi:hypothetical protein
MTLLAPLLPVAASKNLRYAVQMKWAQGEHWQRILLAGIFLSAEIVWAKSGAKRPSVPKQLRPPKGEALLVHLEGKGKQIYVCRNSEGTFAWKLKAPDATLFNEAGEEAGHHFAGPTWEAKDGSRVTAKLVASVRPKKPDTIPWLLLDAVSHDGKGVMANVESIQRLHTKGGAAPAAGCSASYENEETSVAYEADYYFYGGS